MSDTSSLCPEPRHHPTGPLMILGRSLFPLAALTIILGTLLWGPWVSLVLTVVWWRIVTRVA